MRPRLIAQFNRLNQIAKKLRCLLDGSILSLPRNIGSIEIE